MLFQFHRCEECGKEILADKGPLQSHARSHNFQLEHYREELERPVPTPDWLSIAVHSDVRHTCQVRQ